jgi:TRAP-type C4-dicarboxylate transport system permease small subunit
VSRFGLWRSAALVGLGILWALEGQVLLAVGCGVVGAAVAFHSRRAASRARDAAG